jgi:hypothetical protein
MAEVLGLVSGGAGLASLAIQFSESAVSVRRFYKSMQKAPAIFENLATRLDSTAQILRDMEQLTKGPDRSVGKALARGIERCEDVVKGLSG